MTEATKTCVEYRPVVLHTSPALTTSEEQFFEFCQPDKDWRIERTAEGDLEVMSPTGGETCNRNLKIALQLGTWTEHDGTVVAFDSSTGFRLPNSATRSPDATWVRHERLADLTAKQKQKFLPLCPDFAVELRSPGDALAILQDEMREHIENGARLGWIMDPPERRVYGYRPGVEAKRLDESFSLSGEPELPGFALDLRKLWEPGF
ncbi:MAG: Uma2 family endonuclease [Rubrobacteraceae bacterium]